MRSPRVAALALLSLLPVASASCGGPAVDPAAPLAGWSLLLVNIDTLRADHLGSFGYERATSPFLDSLAAEGVGFENAISNSSFTRESVAALLSGLLPSRSGSTGWHATPRRGPHLGEALRGAGFRHGRRR